MEPSKEAIEAACQVVMPHSFRESYDYMRTVLTAAYEIDWLEAPELSSGIDRATQGNR